MFYIEPLDTISDNNILSDGYTDAATSGQESTLDVEALADAVQGLKPMLYYATSKDLKEVAVYKETREHPQCVFIHPDHLDAMLDQGKYRVKLVPLFEYSEIDGFFAELKEMMAQSPIEPFYIDESAAE